MTSIWFIRHGESESNAGMPTASAASPSLTDRGKLQASFIAKYIPRKPDLIVSSPYVRALESAQALLDRFPSTPLEIWPVQEFTYLSSLQYLNTTVSERRAAANKYWMKADPNYWDGPESETFNQMITRIEKTISNINDCHQDFILIYSHGWFIRALLWYLIINEKSTNNFQSATLSRLRELGMASFIPYLYLKYSILFKGARGKMWHYLFFSAMLHMPNASILKFELNKSQQLEFVGFITDHLPTELIGYKSLDK
jgi:broad specificity phosphatase PhoE